jgi:hypothetical protein
MRPAGKATDVNDKERTDKHSQNRSPLFMPAPAVPMQWSNGV